MTSPNTPVDNNTTAAPAAAAPAVAAKDPRKGRLLLLAAVIVIGAIAYGIWWYTHARFFEHTDDAYVSSDMIQITSQVGGTVLSVNADDTQQVARGQLLLTLDTADAAVAMASADAELARAVRQVRGLFAQSHGLQAQINQREIALATAQADLKRRQQVASDGGISVEELQHARDQVTQTAAALSVSRDSLTTNQAQIAGADTANNPQVLAAAAHVRDAALALARTRIVAPVDGTIARRNVQLGSRINAGTPLMAVVPLDQAWVDANFKEVQISRMRIGQPVTLHADIYGDDVTYHGHIAGLGAGSGSAFALLPAQNASGNWIKIVQRVPVRIRLDPKELAKAPLRVGLSMNVEVNLHDTSGSLVATQVRLQPQPTIASAADAGTSAIEAHIAQIIAENSGGKADTAPAPAAQTQPEQKQP